MSLNLKFQGVLPFLRCMKQPARAELTPPAEKQHSFLELYRHFIWQSGVFNQICFSRQIWQAKSSYFITFCEANNGWTLFQEILFEAGFPHGDQVWRSSSVFGDLSFQTFFPLIGHNILPLSPLQHGVTSLWDKPLTKGIKKDLSQTLEFQMIIVLFRFW